MVVATAPTAGFTADVTEGCAPLTVQFTDQSSENATNWSWEFEGGNPSTSTMQNPVVEYLSAGVFGVTLTASNGAGSNTTTQTSYIAVNEGPTADFTSSANGLQVSFTNQSTNATSYLWDFGDSNSSTQTNPTHTYAADGEYTVILTATNACGTETFTQLVVVVTPPTAGFTADVTEGCAPLTVQFTDQSSENTTSWSWEFEGGNPSTSTMQNPVVEYLSAGVFGVTLTASNGAGSNTTTQTSYITVNEGPTADFTSSANGLEVSFTNQSTNATSYLWDFGDSNNSTQANPTHTYAQDGEYTVILTATNACGTETFTQLVVVVTAPTAGFTADVTEGCVPLTVQFTDQSSENTTNWSWEFEGGNPSTSTMQNPVVEYLSAGVFGVTLTASNGAGSNTTTQTSYITVNEGPTADFTSSANGLEVSFTNQSANADSYLWHFGDSNSSTLANPTHTYAQDGEYTVILTATNACGTEVFTQLVVVVTPPTAGFTADVTEGCAPLTVQFTDQSSENATSWSWEFEGGNPSASTAQNPVVEYLSAGVFGVTLTVSNAAGNSTTTQTSYIAVNDVPTAGFGSTVDGVEATFTNTSTNATSYLWDFGDGDTSTELNPVHSYDADDAYTVVLTATNDCGSVTSTQTVIIAASGPVALFSADAQQGCTPFIVQFQNLSSDNSDSFSWSFPGGDPATSIEENPLVIYNAPGIYDVSLIATNMNGSDTTTVQTMIEVGEGPEADFTAAIMGNTVQFTDASDGASSWSWTFGDGAVSSEQNPVHTYAQTGNFSVTLVVTNECGTATYSEQIAILAVMPVADFTAETQEGCVPLTVQFVDLSQNDPTAWNWTFQGGTPSTSTEQNPVVIYNNPGEFNVALQVTNLAGTNSLVQNQYILVSGLPVANFLYDADLGVVSFTNTSTGGQTYDWDFGDGGSSASPSPTHIYQESGMYTVVLTVTNDCGSVQYEETIEVFVTSVEELAFLDRFVLFPNPNDGHYTLELSGRPYTDGPIRLRWTNLLGQTLGETEIDFHSGAYRESFDQQDWPRGVYLLQLQAGQQTTFRKVVFQ